MGSLWRDSGVELLSGMKVIELMSLTLVIMTCHGDTTSDHDCRLGEECVPFNECQEFTKLKDVWTSLSSHTEAYKELLLILKSKVCKKRSRHVCCQIESGSLSSAVPVPTPVPVPAPVPTPVPVPVPVPLPAPVSRSE